MKLNSLIDFLPFEFKDQDTYKVDGKGILERYLEIFGDYFQDVITPDIDNILDIIDIDTTPGYYLNYLWEFLGELPFANTPTISEDTWKLYFAGFKDDDTMEQLCDQWLNYRTGVLEFDTDTVRTLLKCSLALFKIRGTKQFFEILFRLYGLGITITDPVDENTDLWIEDNHPLFDNESISEYDKDITYDNLYQCEQCVEVPITISDHGFTSVTDEFLSFKKSIDALFDRFLPYFAQPNITYQGITINYNYQITAVAQITPTLIQGEIDEIPILVTVTANYDDADLRWQVSGDGINWSTTYYDSGTLYYGKIAGTLYFRCVGDTSVITTVTITKTAYIKAYNIWGVVNGTSYSNTTTVELPTWEENEAKLEVTVYGTLSYKGVNYSNLNIRCVNTGEILSAPATFTITQAGTYVFQLVDFPVKTWTLVVTAEEEFIITCDPEIDYWDASDPPSTTVTVTAKYLDPSTLTIMRYVPTSSDYSIGTNPATFTATGIDAYYFYCAEDPDATKCTFSVISSSIIKVRPTGITWSGVESTTHFSSGQTVLVTAPIIITLNLLVETYQADQESYDQVLVGTIITVNKYSGSTFYTYDTIEVTADMIITSGTYVQIQTMYSIDKTGKYSYYWYCDYSKNGMYSTTYTITSSSSTELALYIEPYDENDSGWINYDPDGDEVNALTYQFDDTHTVCKFYLTRSDGVSDTATRQDDQSVVTVGNTGDPITYSKDDVKSGTYTFRLDSSSTDYFAYLTLQKETPSYTIWCDPAEVTLTSNQVTASTTVYVTMTPEDTSGEFTWNITVPGLDVTRDAKDGYTFTTQATGEFVFTVADTVDTDNPISCTFKVNGNTYVQPTSLTWSAENTDSQIVTITTYDANQWTAEITTTP